MSDHPPPIMQYFDYLHLPPGLQEIARPFYELAREMVRNLPSSPELSAGLRKLLEAKDCAVRAALPPRSVSFTVRESGS